MNPIWANADIVVAFLVIGTLGLLLGVYAYLTDQTPVPKRRRILAAVMLVVVLLFASPRFLFADTEYNDACDALWNEGHYVIWYVSGCWAL